MNRNKKMLITAFVIVIFAVGLFGNTVLNNQCDNKTVDTIFADHAVLEDNTKYDVVMAGNDLSYDITGIYNYTISGDLNNTKSIDNSTLGIVIDWGNCTYVVTGFSISFIFHTNYTEHNYTLLAHIVATVNHNSVFKYILSPVVEQILFRHTGEWSFERRGTGNQSEVLNLNTSIEAAPDYEVNINGNITLILYLEFAIQPYDMTEIFIDYVSFDIITK